MRTGKEDGGIARHSNQCSKDINWKKLKFCKQKRNLNNEKLGKESNRKKLRLKGMTPLNNHEHPEDWKAIILGYTKLEPSTKE